jgi:hypothetical protein
VPQPPPAPLDNTPSSMYASMRAAPAPPAHHNTPPTNPASNIQAATASPATQRGTKGPLPRPPSTQSMKQAYTNQEAASRIIASNSNHSFESPKSGKGSEIYGTIRNAATPAVVAATALAKDRALHTSAGGASSSPLHDQKSSITPVLQPATSSNSIPPGDVGMDDLILDSVIIPAIESVSSLAEDVCCLF